ncbi:MAG: hypothetical protein LBT53_04330 [Puniceicoccales bacterium]|jgi:hypothetical protein|nr:hypothetical protein [Puniceicoccales bacterium]
MNKHFDKLLFLLAIIVCAAGFGSAYWLRTEALKERPAPKINVAKNTANSKNAAATEKGYEGITLKEINVADTEDWTEPVRTEPEGDNFLWKYEMFTPPKIIWSTKNSYYMPDGVKVAPEPPFGVKLLSMAHPVYRLIVKGTDERSAYITDSTVKSSFERVKKGETNLSLRIKVLDFWVAGKAPKGVPVTGDAGVKILDTELNREFILLEGKPVVFNEISVFAFARTDNPSETWTWGKIGDSKKIEGIGEFILEAADFSAKTVRLKKNYEARNIYGRTVAKTRLETLTQPAAAAAAPPPVATRPPAPPVTSPRRQPATSTRRTTTPTRSATTKPATTTKTPVKTSTSKPTSGNK